MSGTLDVSGGRMVITKDGRVSFDTSAPAARLARDATITLTGYDIDFPDLDFGVAYSQFQGSTVIGGVPTNTYGCSTFAAITEQEWGPLPPNPLHTLTDDILAVAPPGANYLDVNVHLTNTVVPSTVFGDLPILSPIPNHSIRLEGGACLVESYGVLRRMFNVEINSGYILLRRRQSVSFSDNWWAAASTSVVSGNQRYFFSSPSAPYDGRKVQLGELIQTRGLSAGVDRHKPGDSQECSQDLTGINYHSVWSGDITIIPGRVS